MSVDPKQIKQFGFETRVVCVLLFVQDFVCFVEVFLYSKVFFTVFATSVVYSLFFVVSCLLDSPK